MPFLIQGDMFLIVHTYNCPLQLQNICCTLYSFSIKQTTDPKQLDWRQTTSNYLNCIVAVHNGLWGPTGLWLLRIENISQGIEYSLVLRLYCLEYRIMVTLFCAEQWLSCFMQSSDSLVPSLVPRLSVGGERREIKLIHKQWIPGLSFFAT